MKPKRLAYFAATSTLLVTALTSHSVTAATLYWKDTAGTFWDEPAWSTLPGGPYTAAWVENSDVVFEDNGGTALSIGGPTNPVNFASITANENVTVSPFSTLGTTGAIAPVTVAAGKTLDFSTQLIDTLGGTGFIKNGPGTWILANTAAYPGGFTLNAGTVAVGSVNALGSGGALTISGGTTLRSNAATTGGDRNLSGKFGGGITINGDCTLGDTTSTGILTFNNPVNLGGGVRTLTVNSGVTLAAGATLTNGGIIKNGGGILTLSDTTSYVYTGGFTLNAGTVSIAGSSNLGNGGTLALNGGTLTSTAASVAGRDLTGKFTGITIGGDPSFTGGISTGALTFDANVNLGSATRTITVNTSSHTAFTGAGVISGAPGVGIIKAGSGVLYLNGSNVHTLSGPISVNAGGLTIGGTAAQSFPGGISVNGGTLTFIDSAAHTLDGGVTVNSGTVVYNTTTAPSFMNQVKVNGGAITYNYGNMVTPADMIPNGSALILEKSIQRNFSGKSNTDSSQTFGDLTINGGRQTMVITPSGTGKMTVTLNNSWTRNDNAVLHVTLNGALGLLTSNPGVTNGIIGPWCTTLDANGTRYATVSGGNVAAFTTGTAATDATALGNDATINYDLAAGGAAPATSVSNTIRYTGAVGTLTPGATSFSTNGLLNAAGSGSILTVGAGTLTIGANKELVVNNNLNRGITINSTIVDNSAGASGVTLVGVSGSSTSTTILSNIANSFTGPATINGTNVVGDGVRTIETTAQLAAAGANSFLGAGSKIILNGAMIQLTPGLSAGTNRDIVINANGGLYLKGGNSVTLSGAISGSGNLTVDCDFLAAARIVLSGSNTFTGDVLLQADGKVTVNHVDALQNSTLNLSGLRVSANLGAGPTYNIGGLKGNTPMDLGTAVVSIGNNNQSNEYWALLSGTTGGLTKVGTGIQTIRNANTYSGNTTVNNGVLKLNSIPQQTDVAVVVSGTGGNLNKFLAMPSAVTANMYIGQPISGPNIPVGTKVDELSAGSVKMSVGATAAGATTASFAGVSGGMPNSPVIEVASGGTLDASALPSAFEVGTTQILGGAGTVTGAINVSGILSPGVGAANLATTTGTITTGNATFDATGEYVCTINGASSDTLTAGALTIDPAATVTFSGTPTATSYVIATYTGAAPTHFATDGTLPAGYALDYTTLGQIKLVGTPSATAYETWAANPPNNLTGPSAQPGADPDFDGVKNIAEFALGGNPKDGSANGASLAKVQDVSGSPALTLTFLTRSGTTFAPGSGPRTATKDGVTYSVQGGQDLGSWTADITEVPAITAGMDPAPVGYEYHTFRTAGPVASTARDFIRVQVVGQ